jgi:hypothetical protein
MTAHRDNLGVTAEWTRSMGFSEAIPHLALSSKSGAERASTAHCLAISSSYSESGRRIEAAALSGWRASSAMCRSQSRSEAGRTCA